MRKVSFMGWYKSLSVVGNVSRESHRLALSLVILLLQGKGTITTYFLNGKDGFTKPLPDLKEAASLSDHEFK